MSVDEVKSTIREGIQAAREGAATIEQVAAEAAELTLLARAILHDSSHAEVQKGLAQLTAAAHEADLTLRRLSDGTNRASEYLDSLG